MIRSWWDQLLIIYIPSLNVPYIWCGKGGFLRRVRMGMMLDLDGDDAGWERLEIVFEFAV